VQRITHSGALITLIEFIILEVITRFVKKNAILMFWSFLASSYVRWSPYAVLMPSLLILVLECVGNKISSKLAFEPYVFITSFLLQHHSFRKVTCLWMH